MNKNYSINKYFFIKNKSLDNLTSLKYLTFCHYIDKLLHISLFNLTSLKYLEQRNVCMYTF